MVSLKALLELLDKTPVVADMPSVSRCFLPPDVAVYERGYKLIWTLDKPGRTLPERAVLLKVESQYSGRFPHVRVEHDPFTPELNKVIYDRFDEISELMLVQSDLASTISEQSGTTDVVALVLIDGLSYRDVRFWMRAHPNETKAMNLDPCLVDGPTLTGVAFPRVVGNPQLAVRLFDRGYHNRLGFTYWTRNSNRLTDMLFFAIPNVSVTRDISSLLKQIHEAMLAASDQKTYIQVVRTGLDGYAHHQKRKPPVENIVDSIMREVLALKDLLLDMGKRASIYLASDHGILWRDEFVPQVVGHAPAGANPRVCGWRELYYQDMQGHRFVMAGEEFYSLGYPYLRRSLRIDEQGVHGGISFQESVVPFLTVRV